ncbi:MAG: hypothetical protein AAB532_00140 [Patescibacteria group bacterium]
MESKFCKLCQTTKNIEEFPWKIKAKIIRQSYCKICQNRLSKEHYYNNKEYYLSKAKKRNEIVFKKIRKYVWKYLLTHPCVDCGEQDIVVLEFDHLRDKSGLVSKMIKDRISPTKVKQEIEKCDVRCANCHRRKTAIELEWKKALLPR